METIATEPLDVKVYVSNKVFNDNSIKKRVQGYVDRVYCASYENRKIRKAFRNQLYETIKAENKYIMDQLRIVEGKQTIRKRRRRPYKPTPYVQFCRELQRSNPKPETTGKIQDLWKEMKGEYKPGETVIEMQKNQTEEQKAREDDMIKDVQWDYVSSDEED